ncbi:MAG: hypothetical protein WKF70_08925, partial [Chitinophagaceae bacterium]
MKHTKFFSLAIALCFGFVACNDDGDTTSSTTDSSSTSTSTAEVNTAPMTTTSDRDYAALADTFTMGNTEKRYLDARTGKPVQINVDRTTGRRSNASTGEPVWRYVDSKTWRVYGGESWDAAGEARMDDGKLMYRGDGDKWMTYDDRWKSDDETMMKDWETKEGGVKTEVEKDGDMKMKS